MPTVRFTPPANLPRLIQTVRQAEQVVGRPEPIAKAFGVTVLGWIGQTFRQGGRPAWAPLKPWTLAGRRQGRGAGSAQPLQNTGALRNSFDFTVAGPRCTVFSTNPVAVFQEFGTRGPYEIRAKPGHALALPALALGGGKNQRPTVLAGLGRSKATGRGSFLFSPGGTKRVPARLAGRVGQAVVPYKQAIFVQKVTHPGLPARRMLPLPEQIGPALQAAAERLIALTPMPR